jgi:hypothetical protein
MGETGKSDANISRPTRIECSIPISVLKHIEQPPTIIMDPGGNGTLMRLDRSILEKLLANPEDFRAVTKEHDIILAAKPVR